MVILKSNTVGGGVHNMDEGVSDATDISAGFLCTGGPIRQLCNRDGDIGRDS